MSDENPIDTLGNIVTKMLLEAQFVRDVYEEVCTMPDDKSKKKLDAKLISLADPFEVRYWCRRFHCTKKVLKLAAKRAGNAAAVDVEREVKRIIRQLAAEAIQLAKAIRKTKPDEADTLARNAAAAIKGDVDAVSKLIKRLGKSSG